MFSVILCGGAECPTCGRWTEALIGPCAACCDRHARTGRFLRRVNAPRENTEITRV